MNTELAEKLAHVTQEHQTEHEDLLRKKREVQNEADYLVDEQNRLELSVSDLRERLRKKEEDLREIKSSLNSQIQSIDDTYNEKIQELEESVKTLTQKTETAESNLDAEVAIRRKA